MPHPFEMLAKNSKRTFVEEMLVQAIVELSLLESQSGATTYDKLREQVLFIEQRKNKGQSSSGPPVNRMNDGYVDQF